eukprot:CAMPEP_0195524182 /NCGR_PEP_ID=MMETSP0794_2-20130614/23872_1 /TAXON_ID=515487 /ORGANISM="Stephanopyxis turris, Strain CCMP 815" /LENGTH=301 /DNA_ID=CAMNT_0040654351 /DNA_START=43 /DNA_END=948 /DNA_ORIENTATION=+
MKFILSFSALLIASTHAAPAIVWSNGNNDAVKHVSDSIKVSAVIESTLETESDERSLSTVVFVVSRDHDGADGLSRLASSGSLPKVSSKYDDANVIHQHVRGVETAKSLANSVEKSAGSGRVMGVSLEEFNRKLTSTIEEPKTGETISKQQKELNKRARKLSKADVLIVSASMAQSAELDAAVVKAVEEKAVKNVILTATRSIEEVKHERNLLIKSRPSVEVQSRRRRLEDANGDDANGDDGNNNGNAPLYYVNMTPNIFAGILFTLFFSFVSYTGFMCLGMIQGQSDIYASKYPSIGREA